MEIESDAAIAIPIALPAVAPEEVVVGSAPE